MSSSPAAVVNVRTASVDDAATIFSLVQALADYEKLAHEVIGSAAAIATHSTGNTGDGQASQRPYITTLLAEQGQTPIGLALFFQTYSIHAAAPGYYLEDLFVLPDYRQQGVGKALLRALADYALRQNARQLRWSVLDWNELAIAFYRRIGADISEDDRICRVTGDALQHLAASEPWEDDDDSSVQYRIVSPADMPAVVAQLDDWVSASGWRISADSAAHRDHENMDALVTYGSTHPPHVELLQVNRGTQALGIALFHTAIQHF